MNRLFLLTARVLLGCSVLPVCVSAAQDLSCPDMPDKITQVNRDVRSDINAGVGSLGKLKAGEVGVRTDVVAKNLFDKYPNADRVMVVQMMAATYCSLLRRSTLRDSEKLRRWEEFTERAYKFENPNYNPAPRQPRRPAEKPPSDQKSSPAPTDPANSKGTEEGGQQGQPSGLGDTAQKPPKASASGSDALNAVGAPADGTTAAAKDAAVRNGPVAPPVGQSVKREPTGSATADQSTENIEQPKAAGLIGKDVSPTTPETPDGILEKIREVLEKDLELGDLQGCPAGKSVEVRRVGDDISYYACAKECFASWQTVNPRKLDFRSVKVTQPFDNPNFALIEIPCSKADYCTTYKSGTFPGSKGCVNKKVKTDYYPRLAIVVHVENVDSVVKFWKEFARVGP